MSLKLNERLKEQKRTPFLPILLFLLTYFIVYLYNKNGIMLGYFIALSLTIVGIYYALKPSAPRSTAHITRNQAEQLSDREFSTLLSSLFERRGYRVNCRRSEEIPYDMMRLKKRGAASRMFLIRTKEPICTDIIEGLKPFLSTDETMSVLTTSSFTKKAIHYARGNKINLIDHESLDAMLDVYLSDKRQPHFIERARILLRKET